ncbi:hypothetical protein BGX31_003148, partial [Mortierella sp. GBA43]
MASYDPTSTSAPLSPAEWLRKLVRDNKPINFVDFVNDLGLWHEEDAHNEYTALLSTTTLQLQLRAALSNQYERWRRNQGKEFWASRAISSQLSLSVKRTAVGLISESERVISRRLSGGCVEDEGGNKDMSLSSTQKARMDPAATATSSSGSAAASSTHKRKAAESACSSSRMKKAVHGPAKPIRMFFVDPNTFPTIIYTLSGDNIGVAFRKLQKYGAVLANDPSNKVTVGNMSCFLALNYIWDTSFDMDLKKRTSQLIYEQLLQPKSSFTSSHVLLMHDLEQELEEGRIQRAAESDDELGNEIEFQVIWANKAAQGSRERRKEFGREGLRPDFQIIKKGIPVLYMEAKPLGSTTEQEYLSDRWKLANLAKDELDACYRKHIRLPFMTIIQIYGRKMVIHTMSLQHGIYHLSQQFQVYIPCACDDGAAIRPCLSALYSVKAWLEELALPPA